VRTVPNPAERPSPTVVESPSKAIANVPSEATTSTPAATEATQTTKADLLDDIGGNYLWFIGSTTWKQ